MNLTQMKKVSTALGAIALLALGSNAVAQSGLDSMLSLELTDYQLEKKTAIFPEPASTACVYCSIPARLMASEQTVLFSQVRAIRDRFGRNS